MKRAAIWVLAATLSASCAAVVHDARRPFPAGARTITCDGIAYRLVTGARLRRVIVGARLARSSSSQGHCSVSPGGIVATSPDGQWFHADGVTYGQEADRVGLIPGTYEVRHDRFCTSVGRMEPNCRMLYESPGGQYLQVYLGPDLTVAIPAVLVPQD